MKLGIIGYGNIAKAMVAGLDGKFNPIYVNDRKPQSKKAYRKKSLQDFKIDDIEKINLDFIFICVKPKDVKGVLHSLQQFKNKPYLISVVAGINLTSLENMYNSKKVIRIMPSTAAKYRKSVTGIFAKSKGREYKLAISVLREFGTVCELTSESQFHEFTSVLGSGQAFIFEILKNYQNKINKFSKNSKELNRNFYNFISSVADAYADGKDLEDLINEIRSPKGTTHAGIISLKRDKVKNKIDKAFKAAELRSKEIQNEYK